MSKQFTELERRERRQADREKARAAVEALKSSEGWTAWLRARRHFHRYSLIIWSGGVADALSAGGRRQRHVVYDRREDVLCPVVSTESPSSSHEI